MECVTPVPAWWRGRCNRWGGSSVARSDWPHCAAKAIANVSSVKYLRLPQLLFIDKGCRESGIVGVRENQIEYQFSGLADSYITSECLIRNINGFALHTSLFLTQGEPLEQIANAVKKVVNCNQGLRLVWDEGGACRFIPEITTISIDSFSQPFNNFRELLKKIALVAKNDWLKTQELPGVRLFCVNEEKGLLAMVIKLAVGDALSGDHFFSELKLAMSGNDCKGSSFTKVMTAEHQQSQYWVQQASVHKGCPNLTLRTDFDFYVTNGMSRVQSVLPENDLAELLSILKAAHISQSVFYLDTFCRIVQLFSDNAGNCISILTNHRTHNAPGESIQNMSDVHPYVMSVEYQDILKSCQETTNKYIQLQINSNVDGLKIVREWAQKRGQQGPLLPIIFSNNIGVIGEEFSYRKLKWKELEAIIETPYVLLDFQLRIENNELVITWDYRDSPKLMDLIGSMNQMFLDTIKDVIKNKRLAIQPRRLPADQLAVREMVNSQPPALQQVRTLADVVMKAYVTLSDEVAITTDEKDYTYRELFGDVAALQERILGLTNKGDRVGVLANKGYMQIVSVIACALSGRAYVPINTQTPASRMKEIYQDSGATLLLTDREVGKEFNTLDINNCCHVTDKRQAYSILRPQITSPSDTAYIIYTSGTTGKPKGVEVQHGPVLNTIASVNDKLLRRVSATSILVSDISFDLSVFDIFGTLLGGGTLAIPSYKQSNNPLYLLEFARAKNVTLWNSVPSFADLLLKASKVLGKEITVNWFLLSGDWVPVDLPRRLKENIACRKVFALGGATEASIWSNWYDTDDFESQYSSIPYGLPLEGQSYHVLHDNLTPCPQNVPGQLYIGGRGLAKGYFDDPLLTMSKFIYLENGQRVYATGDMGVYREGGVIEFLGRIDNQVKVNGYRIELTDVESNLQSIKYVDRCCVVVVDDTLCALILGQEGNISEEYVLHEAKKLLPTYMLPKRWKIAGEMPFTGNGKVDRRAISISFAESEELANDFGQETGLDPKFNAIWNKYVRDTGGRFIDAGGSSVSAISMIGELKRQFGVFASPSLLLSNCSKEEYYRELKGNLGPHNDAAVIRLNVWQPTNPTAVFFHPIGGGVGCYSEICKKLEGKVNCLGIYLYSADSKYESIRDIAELYNSIIDDHCSNPEILIGWSFGGVVAAEVGEFRKGARKPTVIVIDSYVGAQVAYDEASARSEFDRDVGILQAGTEVWPIFEMCHKLLLKHKITKRENHLYIHANKATSFYAYERVGEASICMPGDHFSILPINQNEIVSVIGNNIC